MQIPTAEEIGCIIERLCVTNLDFLRGLDKAVTDVKATLRQEDKDALYIWFGLVWAMRRQIMTAAFAEEDKP